jgi:hypothetical protein
VEREELLLQLTIHTVKEMSSKTLVWN